MQAGEERVEWLLPFVRPGRRVLEIGSGGGRWTQYLLEARHVWCVDINPQMFHYLIDRFGAPGNLSFFRSHGHDLPPHIEGQIDFVFSFGTLVHVEPEDIDGYLAGARAAMVPGGDLVIQVASKHTPLGASNKGFSLVTPALIEGLLRRNGFRVVRHDWDLLPHSSLVHARADGEAPPPWPLAVTGAWRLLAWPRWRESGELERLLGTFGPAMVDRPHVTLCLLTAIDSAEAAGILSAAASVLGPDPHLD